jgi:hypothetical protein
VVLTAVTPAGTQHGLELTTAGSVADSQGFVDTAIWYDAQRNQMANLPLSVSTAESLLKAKSSEGLGGCDNNAANCAKAYSQLTVLTVVPNDGANGGNTFRPAHSDPAKNLHTVSDFNLTRIPSHSEVSASGYQTDFETIQNRWFAAYPDRFQKVGPDSGRLFCQTDLFGGGNNACYGANMGERFENDIMSLMGTEAMSGDKLTAVYATLQVALETYYIWQTGGDWHGAAGINVGRKPRLAWLGALTTDAGIASNVQGLTALETITTEDGQIVVGAGSGVPLWGDRSAAGATCYADAAWDSLWKYQRYDDAPYPNGAGGSRSCRDPHGYIDGPTAEGPGRSYFGTSYGPFHGFALAQWMMKDLCLAANDQPFLDFVDRMVTSGVIASPYPCVMPITTNGEAQACGPKNGSGCTNYGTDWGDIGGSCATTVTADYAADRWDSVHGNMIPYDPGKRFPLMSQLWDDLRGTATNCSEIN